VDWLQVSSTILTVADVEHFISSLFDCEFTDGASGALGYGNSRVGPAGAMLFYDDRRPEVHLKLPGEFCAALTNEQQRSLVVWAHTFCGVARLDVAVDDERPDRIMPDDVLAAVESNRELVTHSTERNYTKGLGMKRGATVTFGRRGSRRYLRCYDKEAQSMGEHVATRWELETRDEAADVLLAALAVTENWGALVSDNIASFVDFRDRTASFNVSECPRSPWFAALVGLVSGKWKPYPPTAPRTIENTRTWLRTQVARSLAMVAEVDGMFAVLSLVKRGQRALTPQQHALVRLSRREVA